MRKLWAVVPLAAVLGLAGACATLQTHVDYDSAARFSQYRTFEVETAGKAPAPFVQRRFESAVRYTLESKGLTYTPREPDLIARLSAVVADQPQLYYWGWPGWWGWGWGCCWGWGWGWWGPGPADVVHVPVGTLVVELIDSKTKDMIWRGMATDYIQDKWTPETSDAAIRSATERMFRDFPPPTRGG